MLLSEIFAISHDHVYVYLGAHGLFSWMERYINSLTLRAAKTGLTNLELYYLQMHFMENI